MRGKVASPSKRAVIVLLKEPNDSICARTVKLAFSGISLVLFFFFFSSILAYLLFSFFASTCLHIWPTVILSLSLLFFFFFCSCHKLPLSSWKWRSVSIGRTGKKKALEIRKPPQFTLISSFTPFYTTILLAPLVITVFFFDFSKPKLYLTEPLSCFFFFPTHIYTRCYTPRTIPIPASFFPTFFALFFSFSCTCI